MNDLAIPSPFFEERLSDDMFGALKNGEIDLLRQLLATGGNPDARNRDGYSLLMVAVQRNFNNAVEALIAAYADINLKGPGGVSAMFLAQAGGNLDLVKILVREYADLSDVDTVEEALEHHRPDIAALILQKRLSEDYQRKVEAKKRAIAQEKERRHIAEAFFDIAAQSLTSSFSAANSFTRVAAIAETAKVKTIEGARCVGRFCTAFAKAALGKAKEFTKQVPAAPRPF